MSEWKNSIDVTAAFLRQWNGSKGGIVRAAPRVVQATDVPAMCTLILSEPIDDDQRAALKAALLSPDMPDAQRLAILAALRAVLTDIELEGGIQAPTELVDLPNKRWVFHQECRLRCDDEPIPVVE